MNEIKNFWVSVEKAAVARGMNLKELATAAGTKPGARVNLNQAVEIRDKLNSKGPDLSLEGLIAEV